MATDLFPGVEYRSDGTHFAVLDSGAHVLHWTPAGQDPVLWVSPLTTIEPGTAVRGGVPLVLPWFGMGPKGDRTPLHGFARISPWQLHSVEQVGDSMTVRYSFDATGFDYPAFMAGYEISFGPSELSMSLEVTNASAAELEFEEALHTYLAVSDVRSISISGLAGCTYLDRAGGSETGPHEQVGEITFDGETDLLFAHNGTAVVKDPGLGRNLEISKEGSASTVVWNPGATKAATMTDVGENWPNFVCVEAANARATAVRLAPGDSHTMTQRIRLVRQG